MKILFVVVILAASAAQNIFWVGLLGPAGYLIGMPIAAVLGVVGGLVLADG